MNTKIEEINIQGKLMKWGLTLPNELAFFPESIENIERKSDFVFSSSLTQIRKIFKVNNLDITTFGFDSRKLRTRKDADLYLPSLFVGLSLISQNQAAVSVALSILANYATDFFKGTFGSKTVHVDIYVEKTDKKTITKINYNGDADGLKSLGTVIKEL